METASKVNPVIMSMEPVVMAVMRDIKKPHAQKVDACRFGVGMKYIADILIITDR